MPQDSAVRPYAGETYYGCPALKASPFGWKTAGYIFLAGLSGSAQILGTVADLGGGREKRNLVRNARGLAIAGTVVGPALLIGDLHTPSRWYNMLRIFRRTSPMSIGSYILTGFGAFSALTLGADRLGLAGVARVAQVPAAVAGTGMSVYTAALLSATSTPLWAASPRLLSVRFGASAMASAAAALSLGERLGGRPEGAETLDRVAMAASAVDLVASVAAEREYKAEGVAGPVEEGPWAPVEKIGAIAVGAAVPLVCHAINARRERPSAALSVLGSLAILAGGMALRSAMLHAGNRSATRPRDYFRFARPRPALDHRPAPDRIAR
ncbi:NrfD/PsrC family molybdoenzyme membrane anchor subunit [Azospirillum rugosum]|uniref:Formate-dependent nitrite reductase membrane component NrfD n=1 Tax=Azospirillum rugosum TaxID=416170 RepID=A0ABS4SLF6_9PROT|nr:NrfD/PsrC family molybdoenzyme membrane anchor subunit [Azospirillum rugosum]MBP2292777.1 formate-dependent nitrite reductase membrane component NrfD [Azospirillum rugosum]MDQ0527036.1 formate-dependent nitrite reductase membrane component NrfD [Azospirillum rugosum]